MPSLVVTANKGRTTTTASLLLMFLFLVSSSFKGGFVSALVGNGGVGAKDVATASELLVPGGGGGYDGDDDASPRTTRARVNEIDFCMAPADVTLSLESSDSTTRVLNLASNRAVRRIILSRSWPSAEALNASLRSVLAGQRQREDEEEQRANDDAETVGDENGDNLKCPVPQPILDVIMRRRGRRGGDAATAAAGNNDDDDAADVVPSTKRGRSGTEWVKDQLSAFRTNFGDAVGYREAAAYLECVLALATDGTESPLVEQVMEDGVYDESYQRLKSVLRSVGVVFENVEDDGDGDGDGAIVRTRIAPKMVDQDICLSMLDKISLQRDVQLVIAAVGTAETTTSTEEKPKEEEGEIEASTEDDDNDVDVAVATMTEEDEPREKIDETTTITTTTTTTTNNNNNNNNNNNKTGRRRFPFFFMSRKDPPASTTTNVADDADGKEQEQEQQEEESNEEVGSPLDPSDLGGVLLSAEEPTVTRQLNVLANIVRRTLLFGGDEELAVLSETLAADRPAFVRRWYPDRGGDDDDPSSSPAAVRFLDALVGLLRDCGAEGRVRDLAPPVVLAGHDGESYRNAYGRLAAGLVELGSGYLAPPVDAASPPYDAPPPKTPSEELGRLAAWESAVRAGVPYDAYPDDLVGEWEVRDEVVGGRAIGASRVALAEGGGVVVLSPERDDGTSGRRRRGLRWRLDPGPTHLDTCTFQALDEDDGTVLQYKGFVDRGARLESRFSKRPITIRGAVTFQMRDGESSASEGYRRDMLPIGYNKLGTTRFVMTKSVGGGKDEGGDAAGN